VVFARVNVENQLKDVHRAFGEVTQTLADFQRIEGTQSLAFTRQMTQAIGAIGPRLEQEVQRVDNHPLDPYEFDQQYQAQRELLRHALTPRGRRIGPHNPLPHPQRPSSLRNEVVPDPGPQPDPKVKRSRSR